MGTTAPAIERDPVIEEFKKDIHRTLLRENLKLTVEQRILKMQAAVHGMLELRDAARRRTSVRGPIDRRLL